jgi:GNAT superfamily N-acetyltransferase
MELKRIGPDDPALPAVLTLIRTAFAYMDGIVDPPSSMHRLTIDSLRDQATTGEVWAIGSPPLACALFTPQSDSLNIGKLAVLQAARGHGHARRLMDHAAVRARALGRTRLVLQSRVELTTNHALFRAMGFSETGRTAHAGFDRPTSITFQRMLGPADSQPAPERSTRPPGLPLGCPPRRHD